MSGPTPSPGSLPEPLTGPLAENAIAALLKRTPLLNLVRRLNPTDPVDGTAKMILEYEVPGPDGGDGALEGLPLLWTHADFSMDGRRLSICEKRGMPADGTAGEAAGRRVGEMLEKAACGTTGVKDVARVWGLTDHPNRFVLSDGSASLADRIELLWDAGYPGPYVLVHYNRHVEQSRMKVLHYSKPGKYQDVAVHFVLTPFIAETNEAAVKTEVLFDCSPGSVCVVESLSPRLLLWEDKYSPMYKVIAGWTLWMRKRKADKVGVVHSSPFAADAPLEARAA